MSTLRWLKGFSFCFLAVAVIISTKLIAQQYQPGTVDTPFDPVILNYISWAVTAPLILLILIIRIIERKMK